MKISVSMCVYGGDKPEWFKSAVDSVLNQTYSPAEIVLVVDGSVPNDLDTIISEYEKNPLFNVIRLENQQGHGNARRIGLNACKFKHIALMDSDDICDFNRFEKQINLFIENPNLDVVGGNIAEFIDDESNIIDYRVVPNKGTDIYEYLKKRCPFNQMTVMFKKESVQIAGGYLDWFCNEDYYLWIRMYLNKMNFANLNDVLVKVRVGPDMYKRRGGWKYFFSEFKLQKYMLSKGVIGMSLFLKNVFSRFVIQIMMPTSLRGFVFKHFARKETVGLK